MVTTPVTGIGATNASIMRTCHPFLTGHAHEACLWWHCFSQCTQGNPTTAGTTATSKGVQDIKPYCLLHKVLSCTTATQFSCGTGAIPYSDFQNNTASKHLVHPIFRPMPSLGAVWTWDDRICLSLRKAFHSWHKNSLAVLDQESGQLLEHCQLQRDPHYKEVWDCSNSNELGRLCQGIGTGDKAGIKQVAETNTFHLIPYSDIPHHKCKEIIYTKVVCEIQEGKDDENCSRITVREKLISYPGNAGTNMALLDLIKFMLNSVILCKGAQFWPLT